MYRNRSDYNLFNSFGTISTRRRRLPLMRFPGDVAARAILSAARLSGLLSDKNESPFRSSRHDDRFGILSWRGLNAETRTDFRMFIEGFTCSDGKPRIWFFERIPVRLKR